MQVKLAIIKNKARAKSAVRNQQMGGIIGSDSEGLKAHVHNKVTLRTRDGVN